MYFQWFFVLDKLKWTFLTESQWHVWLAYPQTTYFFKLNLEFTQEQWYIIHFSKNQNLPSRHWERWRQFKMNLLSSFRHEISCQLMSLLIYVLCHYRVLTPGHTIIAMKRCWHILINFFLSVGLFNSNNYKYIVALLHFIPVYFMM